MWQMSGRFYNDYENEGSLGLSDIDVTGRFTTVNFRYLGGQENGRLCRF